MTPHEIEQVVRWYNQRAGYFNDKPRTRSVPGMSCGYRRLAISWGASIVLLEMRPGWQRYSQTSRSRLSLLRVEDVARAVEVTA